MSPIRDTKKFDYELFEDDLFPGQMSLSRQEYDDPMFINNTLSDFDGIFFSDFFSSLNREQVAEEFSPMSALTGPFDQVAGYDNHLTSLLDETGTSFETPGTSSFVVSPVQLYEETSMSEQVESRESVVPAELYASPVGGSILQSKLIKKKAVPRSVTKAGASSHQKNRLEQNPIKKKEDEVKQSEELASEKKLVKAKPIHFSDTDLPDSILELLSTPYRCYTAPKQENAKIVHHLLELGYITSTRPRRPRKYCCRYAPSWLPPCQFPHAQSGSDIVRHLGTHAKEEQQLIERGILSIPEAGIRNVYLDNPGWAETIDEEICTCYACGMNFARRDSLERHYRNQHHASEKLIKEIAAAVRGRKMHLGY